jgi:uncharacterized protein YaiI (UPF0178 family)
MNVIGSRPDGWWRDRSGAIERLAAQLERWAERRGERVTVVLERRPRRPLPVAAIAVEWAPEPGRDAADDEIVRRLGDWVGEGAVTVVTSDRELAARARAAGAAVEPSSRFRAELEEL